MCRNYLPEPLPDGLVADLLDQARRSPSAGNTQAVEFCVVTDPERYWRLTLTPERRADFPWPGLLMAPVLVVVLTEPERYVERYAEPRQSPNWTRRQHRRLARALLVGRRRHGGPDPPYGGHCR